MFEFVWKFAICNMIHSFRVLCSLACSVDRLTSFISWHQSIKCIFLCNWTCVQFQNVHWLFLIVFVTILFLNSTRFQHNISIVLWNGGGEVRAKLTELDSIWIGQNFSIQFQQTNRCYILWKFTFNVYIFDWFKHFRMKCDISLWFSFGRIQIHIGNIEIKQMRSKFGIDCIWNIDTNEMRKVKLKLTMTFQFIQNVSLVTAKIQ